MFTPMRKVLAVATASALAAGAIGAASAGAATHKTPTKMPARAAAKAHGSTTAKAARFRKVEAKERSESKSLQKRELKRDGELRTKAAAKSKAAKSKAAVHDSATRDKR